MRRAVRPVVVVLLVAAVACGSPGTDVESPTATTAPTPEGTPYDTLRIEASHTMTTYYVTNREPFTLTGCEISLLGAGDEAWTLEVDAIPSGVTQEYDLEDFTGTKSGQHYSAETSGLEGGGIINNCRTPTGIGYALFGD